MKPENTDPIQLFKEWQSEEIKKGNFKHKTACCLSTIGLDGFPNARYVSLKEIYNDQFVITGSIKARKGLEINANSKVAITFWCDKAERQVRIQGEASFIPASENNKYFDERNRDSKIVSTIFNQGEEIESITTLNNQFEEKKASFENKEIKRPDSFGGIYIKPVRIEFMQFQQSRLHERTLFTLSNSKWEQKVLQP